MWLIPQFMKKPSSSSLFSRLFWKQSRSSGLRDEKLSLYVEVANFVPSTCSIDDVVARAVKYLETYHQAHGMEPTEFANKLYTRPLRCSMEHEEKKVTSLFIEHVEEAKCDNVQMYCSENQSEHHNQLAQYVAAVTETADTRSSVSSSTNPCSRNPLANGS